MALAADTPKESFRLSMLIYDTRFRAITIQVLVLILVLLGVAWLLNTTIENLAATLRFVIQTYKIADAHSA